MSDPLAALTGAFTPAELDHLRRSIASVTTAACVIQWSPATRVAVVGLAIAGRLENWSMFPSPTAAYAWDIATARFKEAAAAAPPAVIAAAPGRLQ